MNRETRTLLESLAREVVADPSPTAREWDDFFAMLLSFGVRPLGF